MIDGTYEKHTTGYLHWTTLISYLPWATGIHNIMHIGLPVMGHPHQLPSMGHWYFSVTGNMLELKDKCMLSTCTLKIEAILHIRSELALHSLIIPGMGNTPKPLAWEPSFVLHTGVSSPRRACAK